MIQKTTIFNSNRSGKSSFFALFVAGFAMFGANAQTYFNGGITTGSTTKSGVSAPAGYMWSELQNNAGNLTQSNASAGVAVLAAGNFGNRVADDFIVPAGQAWNISKLTFYGYQSSYSGTVSPFTGVRVRIKNGSPQVGASQIVFGDLTTNRMTATADAMAYRILNTVAPAPGTPSGFTRKIWTIEAEIGVVLQPGTYWIEWQFESAGTGIFAIQKTVLNSRTQSGNNAIQWQDSSSQWIAVTDAGNPADAPNAVPQDMAFRLDYTSAPLTVAENELSAKISVFPSPAQNMLTISSDSMIDNAALYDIGGRLVKSAKFEGQIVNSIDVSELAAGNYILKLESGGVIATKKFIKE